MSQKDRDFSCKRNSHSHKQNNNIYSNECYKILLNDDFCSNDDLDTEIVDNFTISTENVRTYKVGLRVPESLLHKQNKLIVEREVLHYLRKLYNDEFIENSYKDKIDNGKRYESA